ncbi:hypothetical protein [Pelagerythrobacter rhizovicinus]|uniref:hypothetical protein n=1 Tax=Pelagerythrobacter rhizovicinus TaxID=2268576 RepID=UPI002989CFFC|nr:hypothetical protein [Pelagerythrobacter rhizovicinus]
MIEDHAPPVIKRDLHAGAIDASDRAKRPVLYAQATLVAQEHDPVAKRERSYAAGHLQGCLLAKLTGDPHPGSSRLVERADILVGVREDDTAARRLLLPIPISARDQLLACLVTRGGRMDMASLVVGGDCLSCPFGGELARCTALPSSERRR